MGSTLKKVGTNQGYSDDETCRLEPIENPFGAKVTYVSRMNCYLCVRNGPSEGWLTTLDDFRNWLISAA
jgi:hypothetical protein